MPLLEHEDIISGSRHHRGYRNNAAAARAGNRKETADNVIPEALFIRFPSVSNGLPPPLPSLRSVWELPADVVVFDEPDFEIELVALLSVGSALEDCSVVCAAFVGFRVVVACAELLLDVSTSSELASEAVLAVLVLLPMIGLAVFVFFCDVVGVVVVVFGAAVVLWVVGGVVVVVVPMLWHICAGPTPAKKATTKFCPETPWPPHAFSIGDTSACRELMQVEVHWCVMKSEDSHPGICAV